MNLEEHKIFPLAKAHLKAEDWAEIDAAFLANGNPWEGAAGEYAALFSKIVNMAPAPVGLGG
jgi:branched-chain amino acid transport system ATP-binding protein